MRVLALITFILSFYNIYSIIKDDNELKQRCKSCITMLDIFKQKIDEKLLKSKKMGDIKTKILEICKDYKPGTGEHKFCHEIGGLEDSSQSLTFEVSQKLHFKDPKSICQELQINFPELCRDKYQIQLDWENGFDPQKLSIKQLRKILNSYNIPTKNFFEKSEYVNAVLKLKPQKTDL